jgi:hypothetical protein
MEPPREINWSEANQRYLSAALAKVRRALEEICAQSGLPLKESGTPLAAVPPVRDEPDATTVESETSDASIFAATRPPALELLSRTFNLSEFERNILLLCAGFELEGSFASLCARAQGGKVRDQMRDVSSDESRPYVTFSLALAALPGAHWDALSPARPLRHWHLIEIGDQHSLTRSPLRIAEPVLHYLAGVRQLDERLAGLIEPVRETKALLVPTHQALAERIAKLCDESAGRETELSAIQLCGDDAEAKRTIAASVSAALGFGLCALSVPFLPTTAHELETLLRLWERDAALNGSALLVEWDELATTDAARTFALTRFVNCSKGLLFINSRERKHFSRRTLVTFDVRKPDSGEQRATWLAALGSSAESLNGEIETLVSQFRLSASSIQAASAEAALRDEVNLGSSLWNVCRTLARPHLDDLAQRIEPVATWDDLVLPEEQRAIIRNISVHVRQRARVYETWGFSAKGERGLGISALFAGVSGTGKTLAAEVLATQLRLDLYRIDLSQVVSKYIGETEKNLRRVFEAAEAGGAILLFDEADALFGKRSEVKDSHDRYANIEISYLLQRMEAYRGLAILTTNMINALDVAFLRRIRFIVHFPFPDASQRAEIWRRVFPQATPLENLDMSKLACLNVPGGNIRNIALNAAFLAADEGAPVRMAHLLQAARAEYGKLEKSLSEAETGGWV